MTVTVERGPTYAIITVDLSTAHDNYEVYCPGDRISVIAITGELDVRLDEPDNPAIELDKVLRVSVVPLKFTYLYFTNSAQSGKSAVIYVGREASFETIPARTGNVGLVDTTATQINPAKEDGNLATILSYVKALVDDSIKGVLRSIGDAGDTPTNQTGETVLKKLEGVKGYVSGINDRLYYPSSSETFTTTPLDANTSYTSPSRNFNLSRLGKAGCIAYSDVDSATDGVKAELSIDGSNWDYVGAKTTLTGGTGVALSQEVTARYVHFVYVNGGTAQSTFRFGGRYYIA